MRVAALADLHGDLPAVPEADLVLVAGDICPDFRVGDLYANGAMQGEWLAEEFSVWLEQFSLDGTPIVGTWGNHDWTVYLKLPTPYLPWKVGVDEVRSVFVPSTGEVVKIGCCPWSKNPKGWAWERDEIDLIRYWNNFPECDILISHGPPYGVLDNVPGVGPLGSKGLLEYITQKKPKLVVCGHIHESYGMTEMECGTIVVNASLQNPYQLDLNPVRVVDV